MNANLIGVGGAYLFLDERLTALQWAGVALVLVALANISRLVSCVASILKLKKPMRIHS